MTAAIATATVKIEPDLSGVEEAIRRGIATELRKVADSIYQEKDAEPAEDPLRFIVDNDGDKWTRMHDGSYTMDPDDSDYEDGDGEALAYVRSQYGPITDANGNRIVV